MRVMLDGQHGNGPMTKPQAQPSIRDQLDRALTLLRRARAYWKRSLALFVLGVLIAVPYVFTRPRAYRSDTVILYQEAIRSADLTGGEGSSENARRVGARLREMLLSRATLEPIITELHLYTKPGREIDHSALNEAIEELRKAITFRAREGDTFEISFVGGSPKEAQDVTRRLAEAIIQDAVNRRAEQAKTLKEFLEAESERNKVDLKQKEAELANFFALHPALAARLQGLPTAPTASAGTSTPGPATADPILASLESRAARIDRQLKAANQPAPPPKPPPTFTPPPDSAELVAARRDLLEKSARYTDKHPDVIAARARLRAAEAQQAATNQAALEAFRAQNQAAQDPPPPQNAADEAALRKELSEVHAQIAARRAALAGARGDAGAASPTGTVVAAGPDVALEVDFRRLTREVNEGRERQRQLDEKLFKASITVSSVMNDRNIQVSVLDPAYLPSTPVSKSRTMLLAGLLALSFVLAFALAIVSVILDDRIYDRFDLERIDVLPVIGVIPRAQLPPKRDP